MTNNSLNPMIAAARKGDDQARCEVSDWAVNTIRAHGYAQGWKPAHAAVMMREENARIVAGRMSLVTYLRTRRTGSRYLLSRAVRRAVWAQCAVRRAMAAA